MATRETEILQLSGSFEIRVNLSVSRRIGGRLKRGTCSLANVSGEDLRIKRAVVTNLAYFIEFHVSGHKGSHDEQGTHKLKWSSESRHRELLRSCDCNCFKEFRKREKIQIRLRARTFLRPHSAICSI